MNLTRSKLIAAGVNNLREFGYPGCNNENILTDEIYKLFFQRMLESNRGYSMKVDDEIALLLKEIKAPAT